MKINDPHCLWISCEVPAIPPAGTSICLPTPSKWEDDHGPIEATIDDYRLIGNVIQCNLVNPDFLIESEEAQELQKIGYLAEEPQEIAKAYEDLRRD